MIKNVSHIVITLLFFMGGLFICGCTNTSKLSHTTSKKVTIASVKNNRVTNQGIRISLTNVEAAIPQHTFLSVSTALGATILTPKHTETGDHFYIPSEISKNAGIVNYSLIVDGELLEKDSFLLRPEVSQLATVETYAGPRSIMATTRDYSMLVSIPTDTYDNLLPDDTSIKLYSQFKNTITKSDKKLRLGFAWQRIPAPLETGRISTASTIKNIASQELAIDVFPDLAQDFSIAVSRNHTYADGNQICTFSTSQIKDQYNNIVPDGTLVTFFVNDDHERYWQFTATTVNGYAFAKALHPEIPSTWTVQATMMGIAKSQQTDITFDAILDMLPVTIEENKIMVGPLHSYMRQLVQDGVRVDLILGDVVNTALTKNGMATFELEGQAKRQKPYQIEVKTLGLIQSITVPLNEK
ncbi:MAG: hypothetical protein ABNH00_03835 [Dokdonia sp.]|jgi:hypothetical protein